MFANFCIHIIAKAVWATTALLGDRKHQSWDAVSGRIGSGRRAREGLSYPWLFLSNLSVAIRSRGNSLANVPQLCGRSIMIKRVIRPIRAME